MFIVAVYFSPHYPTKGKVLLFSVQLYSCEAQLKTGLSMTGKLKLREGLFQKLFWITTRLFCKLFVNILFGKYIIGIIGK